MHTPLVAVNRASIKDSDCPDWCEIGSISKPVPNKIKKANPAAMTRPGVKKRFHLICCSP